MHLSHVFKFDGIRPENENMQKFSPWVIITSWAPRKYYFFYSNQKHHGRYYHPEDYDQKKFSFNFIINQNEDFGAIITPRGQAIIIILGDNDTLGYIIAQNGNVYSENITPRTMISLWAKTHIYKINA